MLGQKKTAPQMEVSIDSSRLVLLHACMHICYNFYFLHLPLLGGETLFTLNISKINVQTFAACPTCLTS